MRWREQVIRVRMVVVSATYDLANRDGISFWPANSRWGSGRCS